MKRASGVLVGEGRLCFALAGQGQKVFGGETKESYSPAFHTLSGNKKQMILDPERDFLLLEDGSETYLLWTDSENLLWALAWGSQYQEVVADDVAATAKLIAGQSGYFYILDTNTVSRCQLHGRGKKESR